MLRRIIILLSSSGVATFHDQSQKSSSKHFVVGFLVTLMYSSLLFGERDSFCLCCWLQELNQLNKRNVLYIVLIILATANRILRSEYCG